MNGEGGEGGGGAGGGDEDPSRLRVEKVGISALPKDITRRLPEVGGGDRRWQSGIRGGGGGGGSTSARAAWLVAARWLRRALAAAPRLRRRRRPAAWLPGASGEVEVGSVVAGAGGGDSSVNLMMDLPPYHSLTDIFWIAEIIVIGSNVNNVKLSKCQNVKTI